MNIIDRLLHISATIEEYDTNKLPLYLKNAYDISILHIAGMDCLLAKPKDAVKLVALRKQRLQLVKVTGLECVLYFEKTSPYIKRKLIEESIPFIIEDKDVYLPFLGVALSNSKERTLPVISKISFSTQRLLLTALYQRWRDINVSEAARVLQVSKMTVSRCFNQIQALELPLIQETEKKRRFIWGKQAKDYWTLIQPFLRNPVFREYRLDENFPQRKFPLGGMSALCHYSMLGDNDYPSYAISKQQEKHLLVADFEQVPEWEQPLMLVQVMQYTVEFPDNTAIDPITAYLTLDEAEKQEPRIKMAFEEILEEYVYGSGN